MSNLSQPGADLLSPFQSAQDPIDHLKARARTTGMYGEEIDGLLDIVSRYQRRQSKKVGPNPIRVWFTEAHVFLILILTSQNPLLETAVALLALSWDFYTSFVALPFPTSKQPLQKNQIATLRKALTRFARLFVTSCLSQDRADWLPTTLAMCLVIISTTTITDAAFVVPEPARTTLWAPNIYIHCAQMSNAAMLMIDLLRIRADGDSKVGPRPLKLNCWGMVHEPGEGRASRDPVGLALVNSNASAFDAFAELQQWTRENRHKLYGHCYAQSPFTGPDAAPIASLQFLLGL